ncbi:hypothetical protein ASF71_19885 [Deinococcus sp. Leaf326]|nr:hypothetical protein ASF71_19885 [Deinococcus sp. Leaf326]
MCPVDFGEHPHDLQFDIACSRQGMDLRGQGEERQRDLTFTRQRTCCIRAIQVQAERTRPRGLHG